jgi:iron complex transport system ATP-binding protein
MSDLGAEDLSLAYPGGDVVISGLSVKIPPGKITSIIGANGCGKSTLLRGLARLLTPHHGTVLLDGQSIRAQRTRDVARKVRLLPQGPIVPDGLKVEDLVARGRYPHQSLRRQWSAADERAVEQALALTQTTELRDRPVDELSGGQRQRAWIALVLAQDSPIMLLDEPVTFLDLAHQLDVLGLLARLNRRDGRTIVLVLHDINQASRYSHHVIAMRDGQILAQGTPGKVITEQTVADVFSVSCVIIPGPVTGTPLCVPRAELPARPDDSPVPAAQPDAAPDPPQAADPP